jgi:Protein of unknown function (DUF4235)
VNEERIWKGFAAAVGVSSAILARQGLERAWRRRKRGAPPDNPADADTRWRDAALFAALSGLVIGLVRMLSDRAAAEAWRRVRGSYPPGIKAGGRRVTETAKRTAGELTAA